MQNHPIRSFVITDATANLQQYGRENGNFIYLNRVKSGQGKQPVKECLLDTRPSTPLPWLYDLSSDVGETKNVAETNPQIVKNLRRLAVSFDSTLTKELRPVYTK